MFPSVITLLGIPVLQLLQFGDFVASVAHDEILPTKRLMNRCGNGKRKQSALQPPVPGSDCKTATELTGRQTKKTLWSDSARRRVTVTCRGAVVVGNANRLVGYLASVASASLFYLVWFVVEIAVTQPDGRVSILFDIWFAIFFWLFGGEGAALALMALPWCLAVWMYGRLHRFGLIYFSLIGSATAILIGCGASSLSPKPLFIEDQSFFEGFMIAVERQGICLGLTGLVFGATFWLVSERLRYPRYMKVAWNS
jgi:hypothetical protein